MAETTSGAAPPPTPALGAVVSAADMRASSPLIPVVINEAGLDSPSFRATALHFSDQVDAIERWLEGYVRTASKLSHDVQALEATINDHLLKIVPPTSVTSVDNDYTALALKRASEGSREWWMSVLSSARKLDTLSVEPVRVFLQNDLRAFKELRKALELAQKTFDAGLARYVSQSKTKEASALREDAFAVYEMRKAYLKASMDFCQSAPQLRFTLDKVLVRISSEMWREMKRSRDTIGTFSKYSHEMERVRGWSKEMDLTENVLKRELHMAKREVGESTLLAFKPSRELDGYSASTVPFLGSKGPMTVDQNKTALVSEKQGWLFLRTISGKPARHFWIRRWYYCRDGIFGWLVNGPQGVLQGDEIGVLLCNAKPAVGEERRFCFEVKTKNQTLLLQAETQAELIEWLEVFEVAKKRAFEASVGRDNSALPGGIDPAFAITPPSMPEFSAKGMEAAGDDSQLGVDRGGALAVPGPDGGLVPRASFDVNANAPRRTATSLVREEGESGREHASRIMQKLDLHRKATFAQSTTSTDTTATQAPAPSGGIASLISASHGLLPGYSPSLLSQGTPRPLSTPVLAGPEPRRGSLAPATLAKPPAATSLSKTAVIYSSDRTFHTDTTQPLPTAILANYWGSSPWAQAYTPKSTRTPFDTNDPFGPDSPVIKMTTVDEQNGNELKSVASPGHKKAISMDAKMVHSSTPDKLPQEQFPANYPVELKTNSAQFRLLFPSVLLDEKLVLVFRASWSSTSDDEKNAAQMAGNGRVYVTADNMYFYGHQMGLVVAYTINLDNIAEVTAAPGRDCDFIFLHLNNDVASAPYTRITIKTFLEDLDVLHARINLLIDDLQAEEPMDTPELITALLNLEMDEGKERSASVGSWEEVSANTPIDDGTAGGRAVSPRPVHPSHRSGARGLRKPAPKFQLPSHQVHYEPRDMQRKVAERHFEISAKACFHVLFGDKSFVFPKLYFDRRAKQIAQGPWKMGEAGRLQRLFHFTVEYLTMLGQIKEEQIVDEQTIEIFSDHVTYVVAHVQTPWHLPRAQAFKLVTKIVITHIAKSKCKLAIFTKVAWSKAPALSKNMIERQALGDANDHAEELADTATEQVRRLGSHSRTKRAIQVYGHVAQQTQVVLFTPSEAGETAGAKKAPVNPRTLTSMLFETARSFTESAVTSVIMWFIAALKKLWSIFSAERVLIGFLVTSLLFNALLSSRGTATWWSERKAANYMSRLGVGPNVMMSKAVYVSDLEVAARGSSSGEPAWPLDSSCYQTFQSITNTTDIDTPHQDTGSSFSSGATKTTARRLHRTRQKLGSYRHDLLVAMRIVNSVEREMIQSEWENWLLDENNRCDQVQAVLRGWNSTSPASAKADKADAKSRDEGLQKVLGEATDNKRKAALKEWYEGYCGSCRSDREALLHEREGLSMF